MALPGRPAVPAFPGAQGFGAHTPGGRGGKVLFVTNLNDAGPGSLRAACETPGPRIVAFRVSGLIDLEKPIRVREPFLTIAGQTAPGDGICLRRHGLGIEAHDVVVRYIRSRPGDLSGEEVDAISIGGNSQNVVIDHCSATWAVDENLSPSGAISDITVQWCLIAEGLNNSVHRKGRHGYGSLVRAVGGVTLHHNLWAHNQDRNPRLGDNYEKPPFPTFDVRNNVMYDFANLSLIGDTLSANYIGNYIKPGPSTRLREGPLGLRDTASTRFYLKGNVVAGHPQYANDQARMFRRTEIGARKLVVLVPEPFEAPEVATQPAADAYELVLNGAGATLPARDRVDRRIVEEARKGTGSITDSQWEVGGWPEYRSARPPRDSDRDGMPDDWEAALGLNRNDPSDAAADRDADGYTNIEEYINELSASPGVKATVTRFGRRAGTSDRPAPQLR